MNQGPSEAKMIARLIALIQRLFAPKKPTRPVCAIPPYRFGWSEERDWPDTEARMFER